MKVKIEMDVEFYVSDHSVKYNDGIANEIIDAIHEKTGLHKNLIFLDDYDCISLELIKPI